jgi:hypothetical protein
MRSLPTDQRWALDPKEAATATVDRIHKLLLTTVAHHYQIEMDMDKAEDLEEYKMYEKEYFRLRQLQTTLMSLLKSPVA